MSLNSWNILATVAEYRSITQASIVLNMTASAVSHTVRKIEDDIGYAVFIRERNRFDLTDNGKALMPYVQNYLKSGHALEEEALRLRNSTEGSVCIASYTAIIKQWLPHVLESFHHKYPNVKVTIRQSNDAGIMDWMEHGEIDLALVFNSFFNSSSFLPLHNTPVVCFTPKDYRPRNGKFMTSQDLQDRPMILRADNTDAVIARVGIPFESILRVDTDETCYEYIRNGFGFRITTSIAYQATDDIRMYPLETPIMRTLGLITVFPQYISPSVSLFRKEIFTYCSDNDLLNI